MLCAAVPASHEGRRVGVWDTLGQLGNPDGGGNSDVLGERAVAHVGLGDDAEDPVPNRVAGHTGANRVHLAGKVLAEHQREPVLHIVLGAPGGHGQVEPVHRRRANPGPNLALYGFRYVQFGQCRSLVEVGHRDGAHHRLCLLVSHRVERQLR
jgi:hypothetical protein